MKRRTLGLITLVTGLLLIGWAAIAFAVEGLDTEGSANPDDPSLDAQATKRAEAERPTQTPVPPVGKCPTDTAVCDFAMAVATALQGTQSQAILSLSDTTTLQCESEQIVATSPLCQEGGQQTGYLTAGSSRFGFVSGEQFVAFIGASLVPTAQIQVAAVGCPQDVTGELDCAHLALITLAPLTEGDLAPGNSAPLVLVAARDADGTLRVIAAQHSVVDAPAFRGGEAQFSQYGVDWRGAVRFVPVRLD